ncbi:MAG: CotH kinase family protein [Lachnospiraceae bacterium]|nr:CotH kinase family protein [Lachnospiraceae bacterium]
MIISACLMLLLLMTVSYLQTDHEKEFTDKLFFTCSLDGQTIQIGLWEDEEEAVYYLFLPSCFAEKEIELILSYEESYGRVKIDGVSYQAGAVFHEKGEEEAHHIEVKGPLGNIYLDKSFKVLVSENLPFMMVTVEDKEDLIRLDEFDNKKYIETGTACILDEEGRLVCSEKLDKFKIRGNLTATLDKKPFTFSFKEPIGLCGMAPAVKWNLLANATDGSYIRNKVVLDLANRSIDAYEPDGEFMELYLNGQYMGMYLLTEAVEIGENRIAIDPLNSWFLEIELDFRLEEEEPFVVSERGQIFALRNADGISEKEKRQIERMVNDIESALFAGDGISSISGKKLSELIDIESWAEMWLIQEISGNHDTGIASTFAYVTDKEEPLLYAGPVWDFDGTMGNVNTVMFENPSALTTSIEQSRPLGNANQNRWLAAMYRNDEFREAVQDKYIHVFRRNLEEILDVDMDLWAEKISRSAKLDAFRWHDKRLDWMFKLPEDYSVFEGNDYGRFAGLLSHVKMVKKFLTEKKEFLDKMWIEHADFCVVEVKNESKVLNQDYYQTVYFWVERGNPISGLSQYETIDGAHFYYVDADTKEVATQDTVIWEDRVLEGIWVQEGE